jgi:hypothetical protein
LSLRIVLAPVGDRTGAYPVAEARGRTRDRALLTMGTTSRALAGRYRDSSPAGSGLAHRRRLVR